jgi:tetratricopeptide (TPR) repeat protein
VLLLVLSVFILIIINSCGYYSNFTAYYNTLYNAKKSYETGVKLHIENKNKTGKSRTDRKYFEEAIKKCWKIIEFHGYDNKYSDDAILLIAKSEFYLDKYISSKNHIDGFFRKFPRSNLIPEAIFWRGRCDLALEDTTEALSQFNEALVKAKDNSLKSQIYLQLAEIYFHQKKYSESSAYYRKAFKAAKTKIQKNTIQFYLAESYYNIQDYKKAIKSYKKVLKNPPSIQMEFLSQLHLAIAMNKIGKTDEAIQLLEKMLTARRYKKYYGQIYAELGNIFWDQGDTEQAIYYYKLGIQSKTGEGSAKSAFILASHFENEIGNVDSAVYYYKMVPKFGRNLDVATKSIQKEKFLNKFQSLKHKVDEEEKFIFRWENDPVFRDSLKEVRRLDSLIGYQKKNIRLIPFKDLVKKLSERDTANYYYTQDLLNFAQNEYPSRMDFYNYRIDSISTAYQKDSLIYLDSLKFPASDKLAHLFFDYQKQKRIIQELKLKKRREARSIEQVKKDYKKHLMEYADFLLLETSFVDSAKVRYEQFLEAFQDSLYTPKALYSLYFIHSRYLQDSSRAEYYKKRLITEYPDSRFAKSFLENKTAPDQGFNHGFESDTVKTLYHKAENSFFDSKYDSAYYYLKKIIEIDTIDQWYPKAIYFLGYVFEKGFHNPDSAKFYYQYLVDKFPETPYGKNARIRLTPPKEIVLAKTGNGEKVQKQEKEQPQKKQYFKYTEEQKRRIIARIEKLLSLDYMEEVRRGEVKRFWAKKQLKEFLNEIQ